MEHSAGRIWEEEGEKNPKHARLAQEPDRGETEESPPPPNGCARLTRAAAKGGKGEGDPHPAAHAHGAQ